MNPFFLTLREWQAATAADNDECPRRGLLSLRVTSSAPPAKMMAPTGASKLVEG
jgi:hypothetical protein